MKPWYLFALILVVSCGNTENEVPQPIADSNRVTKDTRFFEEQDINWISEQTRLFVREENIKLLDEGEQTFQAVDFTPSRQFFKAYETVLIWNADSSKILDIGSYGSVPVERGGEIVLEGGEPDNEVALIDLPERKRYRLFFAGPSAEVLDGKWVDKQTVMFITSFEGEDAKETSVWIINLSNNYLRRYQVETAPAILPDSASSFME